MQEAEITKHINELTRLGQQLAELYRIQNEQLTGIAAAQQITLELLFHHDPELKKIFSETLGQILARPESVQNKFLGDILQEYKKIAERPSRTTPEGRRQWFEIVETKETAEEDRSRNP